MQEMAEAAWGMAPCAACLCIQMVLSRNRGKCLFSPDIVRLEIAPSGIEDECQAGSGEYDAAEGRSFDTEDGVKGKAGLRSCAGSDAEERERGRVARVRKAEEHGLCEVPGCMAAECCPGASELRDKQAEEGADEEDAEAGDEAGTLVREVEQREDGRGQDYGKGRASRGPECPLIEVAADGKVFESAR